MSPKESAGRVRWLKQGERVEGEMEWKIWL